MSVSRTIRISQVFGAVFFISWLGAWEYCHAYGSKVPLEGIDPSYSINYHGTILYVTPIAYLVLWGIPVFFVSIGIISAIIMKLRKPRTS